MYINSLIQYNGSILIRRAYMKVTILPYIEPKYHQRTFAKRGYVSSVGRKTVTLKNQHFHK